MIIFIPIFFKRIGETTKDIFMALTQFRSYKVKSNVRKQVLESFLEYWQTDKLPEITSDNFWEYRLLSEEFCLMTEHISLEKYEHIYNLCFLKNFNQNQKDQDKINLKDKIEKSISQNLNFYINKYQDELLSLPVPILYNILNRIPKLSCADKLFDLIFNKSIDNEQLSILLRFFKFDDLSKEIIFNAATKCCENSNISPQATSYIIQLLVEKRKIEINEKIKDKIISYISKYENDFEQEELKLQNEIKELDIEIKKYFGRIHKKRKRRFGRIHKRNKKRITTNSLAKEQIIKNDNTKKLLAQSQTLIAPIEI